MGSVKPKYLLSGSLQESLPTLEIDDLNSLSKKIQFIVKKEKKFPGPDGFTGEFSKISKKKFYSFSSRN